MTSEGRLLAMLKRFDDDSHVETRLCQYEAYKNNTKAIGIMKQIIKAKIEGQNQILRKYGLRSHVFVKDQIDALDSDSLIMARKKHAHRRNVFNPIFQSSLSVITFASRKQEGF